MAVVVSSFEPPEFCGAPSPVVTAARTVAVRVSGSFNSYIAVPIVTIFSVSYSKLNAMISSLTLIVVYDSSAIAQTGDIVNTIHSARIKLSNFFIHPIPPSLVKCFALFYKCQHLLLCSRREHLYPCCPTEAQVTLPLLPHGYGDFLRYPAAVFS